MSIWFLINLIVILFAFWKISTGYVGLPVIFGGLGLMFVLYNWTRHAVFSTIRSNISRTRKIKYATISKKLLPLHKYTGTTALILLVVHAILIIRAYGFSFFNLKMLSGLVTIIVLTLVVITGWLRYIRTTYRRRMVHLILGFCLFGLLLLHVIL